VDKIGVLVADDTAIAREGLKRLLADADDIDVIGEAQNPQEAVALAVRKTPQIVLMDMKWRGDALAGSIAISEIKRLSPHTKVIAITVYDTLISEARRAGADAALTKDCTSAELQRIVRAVHEMGDIGGGSSPPQPRPQLTSREMDVLALLAQGMTNSEIAADLGISRGTAKVHVMNILRKLDASNRTDAVVRGLRARLIDDDQ
jgi:DNA-binding NarL/FixJ family response regulator